MQDILSGDEIISDSYDIKEVDGTVYEIDCQMITLGAVEVSMYTPSIQSCHYTTNAQYRHWSQRLC